MRNAKNTSLYMEFLSWLSKSFYQFRLKLEHWQDLLDARINHHHPDDE